MTTNSVLDLAGYTIVEQLYKGSRTEVYRALLTEQQHPVVIKRLSHEHPSFGELVQFRNQYTITRHLNYPTILSPLALKRCGNGYALVMPDEGFISLKTYWQQQEHDISTVLAIAIQLAETLHYLIRQRIIHKDIKPANILIHPETLQIKLIDFSIASLLPKEQQQLINPNILEGTLAYISPEQTGRMNRGIDYRTDFYSLGVTLFELLTGELPFGTDDPMELVHGHIARAVAFPEVSQHNLPEMLQEIVLKLMAKNAEDRYQSALGLKYDLERCLHQSKATGEITCFDLGARDVSDRFLMPERLYGRETEVQTLLHAFERVADGKTEMMLVAGFSGIGKTAVVNEVHKPITRQKGYFIPGKFDQFNRNVPFSAFLQGFGSLMGQLLSESDTQLQQWKSQILDAVGNNGQVIIEVIPELERIIGQQPSVPELSGSAAQNRFNLLLSKFIQVFTTKDHPLVIFLDDLQWADLASLNLIKLLMSEASNSYLLMIGAYRDNEVFPAHPLMLTLNEMGKTDATVNTITLSPLSQTHISFLVSDALSCTVEVAKPLTELVYQKTKGNPFFTTQFLLGLYGEGLIQFDREVGHWECDIAEVRQRALTDDVVEFMAGRLQKLPEETQQVLKLAACIGNQFDLKTLAVVCNQTQDKVAIDLWQALQESLIIPENETYKFFQGYNHEVETVDHIRVNYCFLHDRVQQAAYSLIPVEKMQIMHLRIGRLLLKNMKIQAEDSQIFEIVNQLNIGLDLLEDRSERIEVAQLNLIAAQKAKKSTAYSAAVSYLKSGIQLLEDQDWIDEYELQFQLHKECSESEYLNGDIESSETRAYQTLEKTKSVVEKVEIYNILIVQHTVTSRYKDAINEGKIALALLGIEWNEDHISQDLDNELKAVKEKLGSRDIQSLIDLPEIKSPEKKIAISLLHYLLPVAFSVNHELWSFLVVKMVNLALEYGHTAECCFGYSFYGVFISSIFGDYEAGYQFGILSLKLSQKFKNLAQQSKACNILAAFLLHWKKHVRNCETINNQGYAAGLESGQLQFVGYIIYNRILSIFHSGKNLIDLSNEFSVYLPVLEKIQHYYSYDITIGMQFAISNLIEAAQPDSKKQLWDEDEARYLETCRSRKSFPAICIYQILTAQNLYLFGHSQAALRYLNLAQENLGFIGGHFTVAVHKYFHSLSLLGCYDHASAEERKDILEQVKDNQKQLQVWASHAQENFQHKFDLIEAEIARNTQNKLEAIELYDQAIAGAKANKYIQEEALANERAAKFYLDWGCAYGNLRNDSPQPNGKEKIAAGYMQEAYYCYARWGAKAKTDDLEKRYPNLLQPILQQAAQTLDPLETLSTLSQSNLSIHHSITTSRSSTTAINNTLDFAAVLKASQALSGMIQLDELLRQLTQMILQNSGGDRCGLILSNSHGEWSVRAIATLEATALCSQPLENNPNVPIKLIQYVKNTQEAVVVDDLKTDLPVIGEYLRAKQPKSILCLPILNQGDLIGVLYLENQSTSGAFTTERILVLNFLCTQAAISMENAQLYQQAQNYAQQLEQSQLQLVQSEKMSALGNLVAGVAHEINNPLGFVGGNIKELQTSLQDITEYLQLYQSTFPSPGNEIEEKREELEIEFLLEDIPKMLDSLKVGCDRIGSISTSLRMFSRADTESKFKANVHDGIDSTLLILKYRLKAKDFRPEIEVIRNYGNLPEINCFPGQLNQVFMNLIANSIDVFDEVAQDLSDSDLETKAQKITIKTARVSQQNVVEILIADNGKGMPPAVKEKIFDHLFTTKGVGKGTGLGLAIARQIVVEKHGGSLEVHSSLGQGTQFYLRLPIV